MISRVKPSRVRLGHLRPTAETRAPAAMIPKTFSHFAHFSTIFMPEMPVMSIQIVRKDDVWGRCDRAPARRTPARCHGEGVDGMPDMTDKDSRGTLCVFA